MRYYFTFGSSGQIHECGWIEIIADTLNEAQDKFIDHYGKDQAYIGSSLRYSFAYTEEAFEKSGMKENGNLGKYCHEVIY